MAKEFDIVSKISLDTKEAMDKWQKFKSDAEKLKTIDIKLNIQNLDTVKKSLNDLLELSNKLNQTKLPGTNSKDDDKNLKKQMQYLTRYKDTFKTIQSLKQQLSKTTNQSSFDRISNDIEKLESRLDRFKSKIKNSDLKLDLFHFKQNNSDLVKFENSLNNISKKAEKLQKNFNSIDFKNVDSSKLEGEIEKVTSKVEELQVIGRSGIDVSLDLNNALGDIERLTSELKNLKELDRIKSNFVELEGSISSAFGIGEVERFTNEISQLESMVGRVDGSFDAMASSVRGNLNTVQSDIKRMNSEIKNSNRFMDDFKSSFMAYTAGNVVGDGIIATLRGIKEGYMEIDRGMTNIKKVSNDIETTTVEGLESIKNRSIEIAKEVGQSTGDVMNAVADTIQAGVSKTLEGSMDIAKQTMMLANVGEISGDVASSTVTSMIRGFSIDPVTKYRKEVNGTVQEVTELTNSMDMLNYASNEYGSSVSQLVDGMQNGLNVLGSYGVDLESSIALLNAGTEVLGSGNVTANGLKSIAINLQGIKSSASDGTLSLNKTAKVLQEIGGISIYSDKSKGEIKEMNFVFDEIHKKWSSFNDEQKAGLSEGIAGKQRANVFQAIMQNYDQYKKLQQELYSNKHLGSMESENSKYIESISAKLNTLKQTWLSIGSTIVKSDMAKGFLDGAIKISESIDNIIKSLDKMKLLTPMVAGFGLTFASMLKNTISGGKSSGWGIFSSLTNDIKQASTASQAFKNTLSTAGTTFGMVGNTIKSAGLSLLKFVGQGLAIAGVIFAVQQLAKVWDNLTNGLKNSEKAIKSNIDSIKTTLDNERSKLTYLNETSKRYEELIAKKKEYENIPIDKRTDEQVADMQELSKITGELAEQFPNLVIGYDSSGSPIIAMANDMDKLKQKTKEQIEMQERLLREERKELANNARDRVQKGEKIGALSLDKQLSNSEKSFQEHYNRTEMMQRTMLQKMAEGDSKHVQRYGKMLLEQKKGLEDNYKDRLELYNQYTQAEIEIQQSAFDQIQQNNKFQKLDSDSQGEIQGFIDNLNWANLDEGQYGKWISSSKQLISLAQDGSPRIKQWNDSLEQINEEYANNGDVDVYNEKISSLAKSISTMLGIDFDTVFAGLQNVAPPLSSAEQSMQNFLKTFNKTRNDLLNGDSIAEALAEQFLEINDVINNLILTNENGKITYPVMMEIANRDSLPDEIQALAAKFAKGGVTDQENQIMIDLLFSLREGNTPEVRKKIEALNKELVKMGMKPIDIKTIFSTEGEENLEQALKKYKNINERKEIKTLFINEVVGMDKAQLFEDIIKNLPTDSTKTTNFILKYSDELSKMNSYKEVVQWLLEHPKIAQEYGIKLNGADEAIKKAEEIDKKTKELDGKDPEIDVKTNADVTANELQDLIEFSAKVEEGKYQIEFNADVGNSIDQINKLKESVNELSNQFRNSDVNDITFSVHTETSAKNISGLKVRLNELKKLLGSIKSYIISVITAQASKNITGLKNNLKSYLDLVKQVKPVTFSTITSTASRNVTGLKNNISDYVSKYAGKTFTTYFKTITSNGTSTPKSNNQGAGQSIQRSTPISISQPTQVSAFSTLSQPQVSPMIQAQANETGSSSQTPQTTSVFTTGNSRATIKTPINLSGSNITNAFKYDIQLLEELNNRIKIVENSLQSLDIKMENAIGKDKIKYLEQQNTLYEEQKKLQKELEDGLIRQRNSYKNTLQQKGFQFNSDNNVTNYEEKLLAMEKEVERLEGIANKDKATDKQKTQYDDAKKNLDEVKKLYDAYIKIQLDDLPNAQDEWEKLNNQIEKNNDEIKKNNDEIARVPIDRLDTQIERADEEELVGLLEQKRLLLEELASKKKEYLDLLVQQGASEGEIEKASDAWEDVKYEIKETNKELDDIIKKQKKFEEDKVNAIRKATEEIMQITQDLVQVQIDINKKQVEMLEKNMKLSNFNPQESYEALEKQIDLLEKQKELQSQLGAETEKQKNYYKDRLVSFGITFDTNGIANNVENVLNQIKSQMANASNAEELSALQNKFDEITESLGNYNGALKDIIDNQGNLVDLQLQIEDVYTSMLETTKKIEDKITDIISKQVEERKKLIDDELKKRLDSLKKEQDAYNEKRNKEDWNKDNEKRLKELNDLKTKIEAVSKDNSMAGQAKLAELLEELAQKQEDYDNFIQDKIDKDINDMFDEESKNLQDQADAEKDKLDEILDKENLQEIINNALETGQLENIDGTVTDLKDAILNFEDKYGDGLSAIGGLIKKDLLNQLDISLDTMKNIESILKKLNLSDLSNIATMSSIPKFVEFSPKDYKSMNYAPSVHFNESLITVQGNVTPDVMPELKNMIKEVERTITKNIIKSM